MPPVLHARYLPNVGVVITLAGCLAWILTHRPSEPRLVRVVRRMVFGLAVCASLAACVALMRRTEVRIQDWTTDETLFMAALDVCPRSAKLHNQMGLVRVLLLHALSFHLGVLPLCSVFCAGACECVSSSQRRVRVCERGV